jgi:hypothetical protein
MADPYSPPPRHRDRSGAVVRLVIVAGLLAVAVWGYTEYTQNAGPGLLPAQEEQVADAGYEVMPEPIPQGAPTGALSDTPPRQNEDTDAAPADDVPPPGTTIGTP